MPKKPDVSKKVIGLRRHAEELLQATKHDVVAIPVKDMQRLIHELQIYQIELKIQNDELRRTQMEIEAARGCYMDLYDFSPAGHLTLDTSGTIVEANLMAGTLLGINRKKLIGQSLAHFIASDDQDIFHRHGQEVLKTGTRQTCQVHLQIQTGASSCVHIESLAGHDEPGQITHWRMALLDITERKRAEDALRESEHRYRHLVNSAVDVIFTARKDTVITSLSPSFTTTLGWDIADWVGKAFPSIIHPEDRPEAMRFFRLGLEGAPRQTFMLRLLAKLGTSVPMEFILTPQEQDGNIVGVFGFARDITDRTRVEDALRQAHDDLDQRVQERTRELQQANQTLQGTTAHLHTILAQSPMAIIELDATGQVTRWNEAAMQTFGWTEQEVLGQKLPYGSPDEVGEADRLWTSILQGESVQNGELRLMKKDGTPVDVSFWSVNQRDPDRVPTGSIGFLIDITKRKRLEAQCRQAQKMEAVGRLAGGMAHDFNNLLTVINGYSALLIDQLPPEDPRHIMAVETLRAGERAGSLTKQLLAFSRRQVFNPQPLDLNDSLRAIHTMLSSLVGETIRVTTDLAPDLWSIHGDKGQLDQVTMNLAINARDAMPNGGDLAIATRNLAVTPERPDRHGIMPPGDYVHVSVRDSGCGMSHETLSHLFEPFFTTKEVGQGTGLGLSTVYGIVKQSEGYIFVDSTLDHGTTFHLYYPRIYSPRVVATPVTAAPLPVRHGRGSETLLVVEDQDSVRALIVEVLMREGYRVNAARNGEEALQMASSLPEPTQILLTDVIMPEMSGPVLAEQLRRIWPGLRVLFMSGYTADLIKPAFLDEPGTAFIQKPFSPDDLARQLRELLDQSN